MLVLQPLQQEKLSCSDFISFRVHNTLEKYAPPLPLLPRRQLLYSLVFFSFLKAKR